MGMNIARIPTTIRVPTGPPSNKVGQSIIPPATRKSSTGNTNDANTKDDTPIATVKRPAKQVKRPAKGVVIF